MPMKKPFTILLLLCFLSIPILAQHQLSGTVLGEEKQPLPNATIVLLNGLDSTMISFALSNQKGQYQLDVDKLGSYILQITYVGYANYSQPIENDWREKKIDLGVFQMVTSTAIVQEITVKAEHIPMGIRGDTISYNAAAFQTRPNATVEDLLKQLPGVEVARDGTIKAQGEEVENVLVDGKEFYGSDPRMATQNLEAEAVDKVEVFDKQSEIAEFTGVDDGEEEKTINLKLKEDYKKGGFGNVTASVGTEQRYEGKLNYFRYNERLQSSVILSGNNLNKSSFSLNDRMDFLGGLGGLMASGGTIMVGPNKMGDGITRSLVGGLNLNYELSEKWDWRSHYLFDHTNNLLSSQTEATNFNDAFEYQSFENRDREQKNFAHTVHTKLTHKVNPFLEVVSKNSFEWNEGQSFSTTATNYLENSIDLGNTLSTLNNDHRQFKIESKNIIKKKFKTKGRSLISSVNFAWTNQNQQDSVLNSNKIVGQDLFLNQQQLFNNNRNSFEIQTSYTEPLTKGFYGVVNYNINFVNESPQRNFFDLLPDGAEPNEELTTNFKNTYTTHRPGLSVKRNTKKIKMTAALAYQLTELNGELSGNPTTIHTNFKAWLPSLNLDFDIGSGQTVGLNYFTRVEGPRLSQLSPIPDNTNPTVRYIGNPELQPELNRKISISFNHFDNFTFVNLFSNFELTFSKNRIVNQTTISDDLFRVVTPINTDRYIGARSFISFSSPIKKLGIKTRISGNYNYANYESFINGLLNVVKENTFSTRLSIMNRKTKKLLLEGGVKLEYNLRKYDRFESFNQNYFRTDLFLETNFFLPKSWTLYSTIDYNRYSTENFAGPQAFWLWNAGVEKFFFQDRLTIKLQARDLLNQNIGYRRSTTALSLSETEFKALGRYVMFGISYKLGKGKKKRGG